MPEFCEAKSQRLRSTISRMKNPLGRDRMLCRGEFGAAVFEKRHSIRSRRAGKAFFGKATLVMTRRSRAERGSPPGLPDE